MGIHNLAQGHYLAKGDAVVTLQALDTLYLDMNLPERELEHLEPGQRVVFTVPSHGEREFSAEIRFIDVRVEATTRNVLVRAVVDNPEGELLPGMFASATIVLEEARKVVTVPREAVAFSLFGETVYTLEPGEDPERRLAHRRSVTTGEIRDGRIEIQGLEAGETIALDTQHRLLEGAPVIVENPSALGLDGGAESD